MGRSGKLVLQGAAVAVIAVLIALLAWQVVSEQRGQSLADAIAAGEKPQSPTLELPLLDESATLSLAELEGKAVVLNFWASWCEPCKEEAPLFQDAWERYQDRGLVIVGVDSEDFRTDARRFVERYRITYPIVHAKSTDTRDDFGVTGYPETYFIDAEGRIVHHVAGQVSADQLEDGIEAILS
jgi:cytochrome c biogenesis protein CcmG/thiol:disulfide interchange protein DsbE